MYNAMYPCVYVSITENRFRAPKICREPTHSSSPPFLPHLATTDPFFYCLHSFDFSKTSYSWSHTVCSFLDWLSSLSSMHSSVPVHGLITHFLICANNIPSCGCTIACFSINLLKDILLLPVLAIARCCYKHSYLSN